MDYIKCDLYPLNDKGERHGYHSVKFIEYDAIAYCGNYLNDIPVGYWSFFRINGDIYRKLYIII